MIVISDMYGIKLALSSVLVQERPVFVFMIPSIHDIKLALIGAAGSRETSVYSRDTRYARYTFRIHVIYPPVSSIKY